MSGFITFEERLEIESMIFQRCSFGEIAKKINKDRSTISREIRRHSVIEKSGYSGFGLQLSLALAATKTKHIKSQGKHRIFLGITCFLVKSVL